MLQRAMATHAWHQDGLDKDKRLRGFFAYLDKHPDACWDELAKLVRETYAKYLDRLLLPVWNTGDAIVRANILHRLDPSRPDEAKLLDQFVADLDGLDARQIGAAVETGRLEVMQGLAKRDDLTPALAELVRMRVRALSR